MTPAGFPHSEILGSQLGYQLPKAYRRFPRPSSAPRAKASTVCPYKLNPPTNNNNKTKMLASTMQFSTHKQQPHPTTTPTPTNPPRTTRDKQGKRYTAKRSPPPPRHQPPTPQKGHETVGLSGPNSASTGPAPPTHHRFPHPTTPTPEDEPLRHETVRRYSRPANQHHKPPEPGVPPTSKPPPTPTHCEGPTGGLCTPHPHPASRPGSGRVKKLLRKEVIQPHLPVRLPCYDLVPIASPTFDGSPPHGLGHRLRVLPTFVT